MKKAINEIGFAIMILGSLLVGNLLFSNEPRTETLGYVGMLGCVLIIVGVISFCITNKK